MMLSVDAGHRALEEEASRWLDVLKAGDAARNEEFADWVSRSPRHLEEFLYMMAVDRAVAETPFSERKATLAEVVPLRRVRCGGSEARRSRRAVVWRWAAGMAASLIATFGALQVRVTAKVAGAMGTESGSARE